MSVAALTTGERGGHSKKQRHSKSSGKQSNRPHTVPVPRSVSALPLESVLGPVLCKYVGLVAVNVEVDPLALQVAAFVLLVVGLAVPACDTSGLRLRPRALAHTFDAHCGTKTRTENGTFEM